MDEYCSERREFGLMTFEDALQKCSDEGLELPILPGPEAKGNVLGYPDNTLPWPPGPNTLGGLGIWLGLVERQHVDHIFPTSGQPQPGGPGIPSHGHYWKRRGFKIVN